MQFRVIQGHQFWYQWKAHVTSYVTTRNTFGGTWCLPQSQVHNDGTVPIKFSAIRPLNKV